MIEQGIVMLVQSDPAVTAIAPQGGFLATLPQNYQLPSWTHLTIADVNEVVLDGIEALTSRRMQIDCYTYEPGDVLLLAKAIDKVLNGYRGALPDPDQTLVQGIFSISALDFFDVESRTYRRSLEYMIWFDDQ